MRKVLIFGIVLLMLSSLASASTSPVSVGAACSMEDPQNSFNEDYSNGPCSEAFDGTKTGNTNFMYADHGDSTYHTRIYTNLGAAYCIAKLEFILGKDDGADSHATRGTKQFFVEKSVDNNTWVNYSGSIKTTSQPTGGGYPNSANHTFNITAENQTSVQYVRVTSLGNWNNDVNFMLTELTYFHDTTGCSASPPTPSNFTVRVQDSFNSSFVNSFTVNIGGESHTTTNSTAVTHLLHNDTSLFDINISAATYFSKNLSNINISSNLVTTMYQSALFLTPYEFISNASISGGHFHVGVGKNVSNGKYLNLNVGTHTITFEHPGYYNLTKSYTMAAGQNRTDKLPGIYNSIYNISAFSLLNSSDKISTFNLTLLLANSSYSYSQSVSSSTGEYLFPLMQHYLYNFTIFPAGYVNKVATLAANATTHNFSFRMYTSNSFNFTIRNEKTNSIIHEPFTLEFVGEDQSYNFTINGTSYIDLLVPSNYTIRYQNTNYGPRLRQYLVRLTDQTHNEIDLFALPNVSGTETTVTVFDQLTVAGVENAIVYAQRFYLPENTYRTVAMYATDVSGKAYFNLEHNDELYKFIVEYPWLTNKLTTEELYISAENINLYINLKPGIGDSFFKEEDISYLLTFNNNTNLFSATYNDATASASQFCLAIKKNAQYSKETLNSSCSTASSGTITLGGLAPNATNYAVFKATIGGQPKVLATGWTDTFTDNLNAGRFGVFLTALLFCSLVFLSVYHVYASVLGGAGIMFAKFFGILDLGWGYVTMIVIASIVLAIFIELKRK